MAKGDADDDDKFVKMNDESLNFLEQVKKGKPRNFVLAVKGSNVSSLLVKKKAVNDKDRKEARGGGFQPVFGVLTGGGLNIQFVVARSDGFDEATAATKTEKLKKYLKEQTGVAYKPEFVLVDTPPTIPFDEEDLTHPLVAKFMKLEPALAKYSASFPELASEIQRRASEVRSELLDEKTRDSAGPKLDDLVAFLKQAGPSAAVQSSGGQPSSPSPVPPSDTTEHDTTSRVAKLTDRLKKFKPLVEQAMVLHPTQKTDLSSLMVQIVSGIKGNQLEVAEGKSAELATLLKSLLETPKPDASANPLLDAFRKRQRELESQLRNGQEKAPDKAEALQKVWAFADLQAQAGKIDSANQALDRLLQALAQLGETKEKPRPALSQWLSSTQNARYQLRSLQVALRTTNHPTALQIVDVIEPLVERLVGTPNSQSEAISFEEFLRSDATITSAEVSNPFGVEVRIRQPLLDAIEALKLELQA